MRFDTIQDYLNKFSICPFCNNQTAKKIWFSVKENSYTFTDENINLFIGDNKLKIFSISVADNEIETELEASMLQAIVHLVKIKLVNECENISCKINGCHYRTISYPLHLDIKNKKIFYPLLERYVTTVALGKSFAEYDYTKSLNRLRLTVFDYKSRVEKMSNYPLIGSAAGNWDSFVPNQLNFKMNKNITFFKDIPFTDLDTLNKKEALISKAKMLIIFE